MKLNRPRIAGPFLSSLLMQMKEPKEYEVKLTLEELDRLNTVLMTLVVTRGDLFIIGLKIFNAYLDASKKESKQQDK